MADLMEIFHIFKHQKHLCLESVLSQWESWGTNKGWTNPTILPTGWLLFVLISLQPKGVGRLVIPKGSDKAIFFSSDQLTLAMLDM